MPRPSFAVQCLAFAACLWISSSLGVASDADQRRLRMKTAQCRAACLSEFQRKSHPAEDATPHCHNTPDCTMCWQTCDLLLSNYDVWGPMCGADNICFPGCQVACKFRETGFTGSAPSNGRFSEPLRLVYESREDAVKIQWVTPQDIREGLEPRALVYVLLLGGLLDADSWEEVIQTPYLNATVSRGLLKQSSRVRLVALGAWGTFAQQEVPTDGGEDIESLKDDRNSLREREAFLQAKHWTPRLVTLRPASSTSTSAVEALVAWTAPPELPRHGDGSPYKYEVTWRVLDGSVDVTGHLYTSRESATLTLWPDVTYAVQVRCFGPNSEQALASSEALVVDTRDIAGPRTQALTQHCPGCLRMEIVAGCAAGLSLLLLVCVVALLVTKTRSSRRQRSERPQAPTNQREIRGVPDKAAHRMHMDAIKPSRLDLLGVVVPTQPEVHNAVQPSGPMSPMGESREDLLDDGQSQSDYFVFDLHSASSRVPHV